MLKKLLSLSIVAAILTSCGGDAGTTPGTEPTTETETTDNKSKTLAGAEWATFEEADMPVRMKVPDTDSQAIQLLMTPVQPYEMNVDCGVLKVTVMEALGDDLEILREDLKNDGLYQCTILEDADGLIVYKQSTPDEARNFHHFMYVKNINGIDYMVKSIVSEDEYSEKAISKMVEFAKTIEAAPAS